VGLEERERRIEAQYAALPPAAEGSLEQVEDRLIGLERLIEAHPLSRQGFRMSRERHRLRLELDNLQAARIVEQRDQEEVRTASLLQAESARVRGYSLADAEDLEGARAQFEESLQSSELAPEEADRIRRDLAAIDAFLEEKK